MVWLLLTIPQFLPWSWPLSFLSWMTSGASLLESLLLWFSSHLDYTTLSFPGPQGLAWLALCPTLRPPVLLCPPSLCSSHPGLAMPQNCQTNFCHRTFAQAVFSTWNALCPDGFLAHSSILFRSLFKYHPCREAFPMTMSKITPSSFHFAFPNVALVLYTALKLSYDK